LSLTKNYNNRMHRETMTPSKSKHLSDRNETWKKHQLWKR
jgi:hypothetical protein